MRAGPVAAFAVVLAIAGCSTDTNPVDPQTVVQGAFETIGGRWAPILDQSRGSPGVVLATECGAPATGVERSAGSAVRTKVFDNQAGVAEASIDGPFIRIAAMRYSSDAAAERAVRARTPAVLERCVVQSVNNYLRARDPRIYGPVAPATGRSIDTRRLRRLSGPGAVVQSTFDELVLGGYDNSRAVSLAVARSGPVVVTVVGATSAQIPDFRADAQFVERAATRLAHSGE